MAIEARALTLELELESARDQARNRNTDDAARAYMMEVAREYSKTLMNKAHQISRELPGVDRGLWPNLLWVRFQEIIDEYHDMLKKTGIIA